MNKAILALNFMYCMERFATAVYRAQSGAFKDTLIAKKMAYAVENERQHALDVAGMIVKLDSRPFRLAFLFRMAGTGVGLLSRLPGRVPALNAAVMIEKRAVKDYGYFLRRLDYDKQTRKLLQRIIADEELHTKNWQDSIQLLRNKINEMART